MNAPRKLLKNQFPCLKKKRKKKKRLCKLKLYNFVFNSSEIGTGRDLSQFKIQLSNLSIVNFQEIRTVLAKARKT